MSVDIYWNGRAYDFDGNQAKPNADLHEVWLQVCTQGLRVGNVKGTDNGHVPREFVPKPPTKEDEAKYEAYLAKAGDSSAKVNTPIGVKT
jgi:hypothetical protein